MTITLVSNPIDLFYLTHLVLSKGLLILSDKESRLYVDSRYYFNAKKKSPYPVFLWEKNTPFEWAKSLEPKKVIFDSAETSFDTYSSYQKFFQNLEPKSGIFKERRRVKNDSEIELLKKAAKLTLEGIGHVEKMLRVKVSEKELAWEFEKYVRTHGASGLSFESIIAFGENSASPHHRAGDSKLKPNQIVLIDAGAIVEGYRGDLTRVVFFGQPNPILEKRLLIIQKALRAAVLAIKPGGKVKDLDKAARSVLKEEKVEALFTHSLGHGIGLETHESPLIRETSVDAEVLLEEGMVFTIEPGLYEDLVGGVRFEEMVVVKNGAGVLLTC